MPDRSNGGPAFPAAASEWIDHPVHGRINRADIGEAPEQGMTLRDWFAGQALAGIIPGLLDGADYKPAVLPEDAAMRAYEIADAMLVERSSDAVAQPAHDDALAWFDACFKLSGTGMSKVQFLDRYKPALGISDEVADRMRDLIKPGAGQ